MSLSLPSTSSERMGSEAVVEGLPEIGPIRITVIRDGATEGAPLEEAAVAATTTTNPKGVQQQPQQEEAACVTPKVVDQYVSKPALVCPSPPRKPRPPKRKRAPPPEGFFAVPPDLSLVFVPLPGPPKKIIRLG